MKKIKLRKTTTFRATVNPAKGFTMRIEPLYSEAEQARENAATVLWATTTIEHSLDSLTKAYIFGTEDSEQRHFFDDEILKSNFFTFSAKKQIALVLIKKLKLLNGKEYSQIESNLSKVMIYRNSFAHGDFVCIHDDNAVYLHYFKGESQKEKLTDEYWDALEKTYSKTEEILKKVKNGLLKLIKNV